MAIDSTDTWIIDSGATQHVCNSMQGLKVTKKFRANEFTLHLGDGSRVEASAMGDVTLNFNNFKYLVLKDCYYIPVFKQNFISISSLIRQGYSIYFDNDVSIFKNKSLICIGFHIDNLFYLQPNILSLHNNENDDAHAEPSHKKAKVSTSDETYIRNLQLGPINQNRIEK